MPATSSNLPERLIRHTRRADAFPFRAVGNRVLLRRVAEDTPILINMQRQQQIIQVGEVLSIGPRWRQNRSWIASLPWPTQAKYRSTELLDGGHDREHEFVQKTADMPPRSLEDDKQIAEQLDALTVGDLVLFTNARVLDHFEWEGDAVLVYPGNWLHGVVTDMYLAENPDARRYEKESFDTAPVTHGDHLKNQERIGAGKWSRAR